MDSFFSWGPRVYPYFLSCLSRIDYHPYPFRACAHGHFGRDSEVKSWPLWLQSSWFSTLCVRFGGKKSLRQEINALSFDRFLQSWKNLWVDWRLCELLCRSPDKEALLFFVPAFVEVRLPECSDWIEFNRRVTKEGGARTLRDVRLWCWCLESSNTYPSMSKLILAGTATSYCLPLWCFSWRMRGSHLTSHWHHIRIANHRCFQTTFVLWDISLILNSTSLYSKTPEVVAKRFQALTSFFEEP